MWLLFLALSCVMSLSVGEFVFAFVLLGQERENNSQLGTISRIGKETATLMTALFAFILFLVLRLRDLFLYPKEKS